MFPEKYLRKTLNLIYKAALKKMFSQKKWKQNSYLFSALLEQVFDANYSPNKTYARFKKFNHLVCLKKSGFRKFICSILENFALLRDRRQISLLILGDYK